MSRLGSRKHPAVARVHTLARAGEVLSICCENDVEAIVGIEPDAPEDVSDIERALINRQPVPPSPPKLGRNEPCPCGSGKKFKKCCAGAALFY